MKIYKPCALNEQGERQKQEDCIYPSKGDANESNRYFLVCDGMGGHEGGEVASDVVCEGFAEFLRNIKNPDDFDRSVFERALNYTYDKLNKADQSPPDAKKMGTTLTFLSLNSKGALMAHIGDSRIYHLRKTATNVEICYKSADHSLVNELIRAEVITSEEAENHPKKNVITRVMQPHQERLSKAEIVETADVGKGDFFFLCSDGVLEQLTDEKLCAIVAENTDAEEKINTVRRLCEGGSKDNFSAYLIEIEEGVPEAPVSAPEIPLILDRKKKRKLLYAIIILLIVLLVGSVWILFSNK
ncbi:MAG: protein phosphatase 2C domain-containing protein [Tannerella sp.]|jgi:serine/threonine protein phosphatase PrpC|nr:protein phosphatase 2C domain-containing protein [Tannerella sp.]